MIGLLVNDFVNSIMHLELFTLEKLQDALREYIEKRGYVFSEVAIESELNKLIKEGHSKIKKASELTTTELMPLKLQHVDNSDLQNIFLIGGSDVLRNSGGNSQEP